MLRLKATGVRFALDDFGTGYSSLLYLRRFPFDKLKIDSSFVRSIEKAPDAAAIVHAVVSLGRGLGMKVTAEGVETAEQHLFLRAAGVHSMQGYRFGRPVTAAEIDHRLATPEAAEAALIAVGRQSDAERGPSLLTRGALEDNEMSAGVQRGLRAGANAFVEFGRHESAIGHFHGALSQRLALLTRSR